MKLISSFWLICALFPITKTPDYNIIFSKIDNRVYAFVNDELVFDSQFINGNPELNLSLDAFVFIDDSKNEIDEILNDMNKNSPMKRLLQGDVGSGKTIVAACAVYSASNAGFKTALMAPTEVLAEQHYNSLEPILKKYNIKTYLLTSSVKDREEIVKQMTSSEPVFFIGTHALIQDDVFFNNLGLAIIDEQQRFGVDQRKRLIESTNIIPHQIVMTATPIPRTTALAVYGDLDISVIDELPPGRKEVENILLSGHESDNNLVVDFAMRYGNPSIKRKIYALQEKGCENLIILPLYPQYAAATTATVCDEVYRTLMKMRWQPSLKIIPHYESDPLYIDALVNSINKKINEIN